MLNDLKELLQIESVMDKSEEGAPFGKNMRKTLDWFLEKARSYGLKTQNMDGYCGFAEYGEGEKCIGILCHLDVVPAGDGWSYPPYDLSIDNGFLYGRGVADDKGPAIVCLHVLKKLKEENIKLGCRVRLIVGCNEENGSQCLKYYAGHGEIPTMSFVPDGDFPIVCSEKGILHLKVTLLTDETLSSCVTSLSAGIRPNVVPDLAKVRFKKGSAAYEKIKNAYSKNGGNAVFKQPEIAEAIIGSGYNLDDFSARIFETEAEIETRGIAGHGSTPEKGDNAIFKLFTVISALLEGKSETAETVKKLFCSPLSAERLGIACKDEKSGALTVNFGIVDFENKKLCLTLDMRLPLCADKDDIIKKIMAALPASAKYEILNYTPNLYVDENGTLIKTLLQVYSSVTGEKPFVMRIGGGTYAKELPNAVAFGPTFLGAESCMHNADEKMKIEDFEKLFEIYYKAVIELGKI